MFEIEKDRQTVLDDLVRSAALDVGDETDATRILFEARVEKTRRDGRSGKIRNASGYRRAALFAAALATLRAPSPCHLCRLSTLHAPVVSAPFAVSRFSTAFLAC